MAHPILEKWSNAVNSHNLEEVFSLYHSEAVLVATFSPNPLTTKDLIKDYFENLFTNPGAGVIFDFDSMSTQDLTDNLQILSGLYTFLKEENGVEVKVPARFTYVIDNSQEQPIAHHHSSQLP